jgi:hypothetical protein
MTKLHKLLDVNGKTIGMGSFNQMGRMLKHHVPDGRYRIIGPRYRLHCIRRNGVIEPDPDGVQSKVKHLSTIGDLLQHLQQGEE